MYPQGCHPVGNCTIPANYEIPQVGDLVEIRYLYAYLGGSLYQPIYEGIRNDISPEACGEIQLKYIKEDA
jgi:bifunctional non-homologous end joining protein LigD